MNRAWGPLHTWRHLRAGGNGGWWRVQWWGHQHSPQECSGLTVSPQAGELQDYCNRVTTGSHSFSLLHFLKDHSFPRLAPIPISRCQHFLGLGLPQLILKEAVSRSQHFKKRSWDAPWPPSWAHTPALSRWLWAGKLLRRWSRWGFSQPASISSAMALELWGQGCPTKWHPSEAESELGRQPIFVVFYRNN